MPHSAKSTWQPMGPPSIVLPLERLTPEALAAMMPLAAHRIWAPVLRGAAARFGIGTCQELAAWLAQMAVESRQLTCLEENLNYTAPRLRAVWGRRVAGKEETLAHQPQLLGNTVYAHRNGNGDFASGDGFKYRGRGPMMLTGRGNYQAIGEMIGLDLVEQPGLVALEAETGALTAAAFWVSRHCPELAAGLSLEREPTPADEELFGEIVQKITGPSRIALRERADHWRRMRRVLL